MPQSSQINAIIDFIRKHPQSTTSRRICREILGTGLEKINQEFASELMEGLKRSDDHTIESYYYLIR